MAANFAQASLSGKPQGLPYDIQTEQARLARMRQLVQALEAQSVSPTSPLIDAGAYKVANWGESLSKVVKALEARMEGKKLDDQEQQVAQDYNQRLSGGVQDYLRTRQGSITPGVSMEDEGNPAGGMDVPGHITPGDPRAALVNALATGIQPLQQLAMGDLAQQTKAQVTPAQIWEHASKFGPESAVAFAKSQGINNLTPDMFRGRPEVKTADGVALTTQDGNVTGKSAIDPIVSNQIEPNTGVPTQTRGVTGVTSGVTGLTTAPAKSGMAAMFDKVLGETGASVVASKEKAIEAMQKLPTLQSAMALTDQLNTGTPWASLKQTAEKVAIGLGVDPAKLGAVTSTEQFTALMSQTALETIKALRPASDADLQYATRLAGTAPVTDPRTAKVLVSLAASAAANTIVGHQRAVGNIGNAAKMGSGTPEQVAALQELLQLPPGGFNTDTLKGLGVEGNDQGMFHSTLMGAMPGQPMAPQGAPTVDPNSFWRKP